MLSIDNKKEISRILKKVRELSKPTTCLLCGSPQSSFCNSHLVPQMVLKSIAKNGKLLQPSLLMGIEDIDIEKGVNNSGTFHFICNNCDSRLFQSYENSSNLLNKPSDKMLAEIALKNMVMMLSKRNEEVVLYDYMQKRSNHLLNKEILDENHALDIQDYTDDLLTYKDILSNNKSNCFNIMYWNILPYVTPIAVQTPIAIYDDLDGTVINETFNPNPSIRIQSIHLCIFPVETQTVVLLFFHKRDRNYRSLWRQFNCLNKEDQLKYINFLVFKYTENYFFSPEIRELLESDEKLQLLSQENNGAPNLGYISAMEILTPYESVTYSEIPNFLSQELSL